MQITTRRSGDKTVVTIVSRDANVIVFFFGPFLVLWVLAGFGYLRRLAGQPALKLPVVLWAVGWGLVWATMACVILALLMWKLFGREVLTVDDSGVSVERRIGRVRIMSARFFAAKDIRSISLDQRTYRGKRPVTARHIVLEGNGWSERLFTDVSWTEGLELLHGPLGKFGAATHSPSS